MDLYTELQEIIVRELAVDTEQVIPEANLQDDLGADSLAILNLAEAIGGRYEIELEVDDLIDIESVGEIVQLVTSRISSKA